MKPRAGGTVPVADVVLAEFQAMYFWRPDDAAELKIGAPLAAAVCARLSVPVPALDWPIDFAVFAETLGGSAAPAARAADPDRLPETSSGGGPVLAIPAELAARWRGTDGDDYDRACAPRDRRSTEYSAVGWVPVGGGAALALDLELPTTALAIGDAVVIARNYPNDPTRSAIEAIVDRAPDRSWTEFPRGLRLGDGRLFLFDAAYPGAADPGDIEADDGVAVVTAAPGDYGVEVAVIDGVDLIRLARR